MRAQLLARSASSSAVHTAPKASLRAAEQENRAFRATTEQVTRHKGRTQLPLRRYSDIVFRKHFLFLEQTKSEILSEERAGSLFEVTGKHPRFCCVSKLQEHPLVWVPK
jgi:hypothetical protein